MVGHGVRDRSGRGHGGGAGGERAPRDRHQALRQDREDSGRLDGGVQGAQRRHVQQGRGALAHVQAHREAAHPAARLQPRVQEGRESDGPRVHQGDRLCARPRDGGGVHQEHLRRHHQGQARFGHHGKGHLR